jgi:hypothetical protein
VIEATLGIVAVRCMVAERVLVFGVGAVGL